MSDAKHRKDAPMADEKTDSGEVVTEPLQDDVPSDEVASDEELDDSAPVEAPAEEAPVEEHHFEPRQGKVESGKWTYYGGWTSQSGFAYNGIELSKEHPTKNG